MFRCHQIRRIKFRSLILAQSRVSKATHAAPEPRTLAWSPFTSLGHTVKEQRQIERFDAGLISEMKKRKLNDTRGGARRKKQKELDQPLYAQGTNEEVLDIEVNDLLQKLRIEPTTLPHDGPDSTAESEVAPDTISSTQPERFSEHVVEIVQLSSTGDGLAYGPSKDHIFVVPFTVPGDIVTAKAYDIRRQYSLTHNMKVNEFSPQREGITPKCKYFGECGGCQLQMISYEDQLKHKKTIVENAFRHFSKLNPDQVPPVEETMGSPLQYGYRTKLSPHFRLSKKSEGPPAIGFLRKGYKSNLDIESCPIGTDIVQEGLKIQRAKVLKNLDKYKLGATILLRESTQRTPNSATEIPEAEPKPIKEALDYDSPVVSKELYTREDGTPEIVAKYPTYTDHVTYTSNERSITTEFVGPYRFDNKAGSFFQNNNSILRPFTSYVLERCIPEPTSSDNSTPREKPIKFLLDAYCGSGLFTITLSSIFSSALGIDIDARGIEAARINAKSNGISNAGFIAADATDLFADVPYPRDQSLVVIDPPRKGASLDFLKQLCLFGPKRVIYVSCNVHTQARDVGFMVNGIQEEPTSWKYEIESLKGFDFFPQTGHVEGVCVLNRASRVGASGGASQD